VPCFGLTIVVEALEYRSANAVALVGRLSGRCPDTLTQSVRFARQ
jgi:hypothetical protein